MDGMEMGREVARLRAERRTEARLGALWRGQPEAAATAAECVEAVREPLRRFDPLRRRPGADPLPVWWAARLSGGGSLANGR